MTAPLRVAMIGHAFMGRAHAQAWRTAPRFFDLPLQPELAVVVGRDEGRARAAGENFGAAESSIDWRAVIARDDAPVETLGGFLSLRAPGAGDLQRALLARGVFTDSRADRLRIGPAPYLSDDQLHAAMAILGEVAAPRR